jgi:hypothetical protein
MARADDGDGLEPVVVEPAVPVRLPDRQLDVPRAALAVTAPVVAAVASS